MNYVEAKKNLEDRLYGIITERTGLPITFRFSGNQKLNTPFIELYFGEMEAVGWGEEQITNDQSTLTTQERPQCPPTTPNTGPYLRLEKYQI
jgi:hypothetical protein